MNTVVSKDGTTIAYDRLGQGQPIILVDGALCSRSLGPMSKLAALLAPQFTVFTYDRRGRGDSGDTPPYAAQRELEDLEALLEVAGGSAFVFGMSSGAVLALDAAARGLPIKRLALYEAPFIVDNSRLPISKDHWARIRQSVAADHRSAAVKLFLEALGAPRVVIAVMRWLPVWSKLEAVAHTLPYDGALVEDYQAGDPLPPDQWRSATMPTLAISGGKSALWMQNAMQSLAKLLPDAQYRTLKGQTHDIAPKALAPLLIEFFSARGAAVSAPTAPEVATHATFPSSRAP